MFGKKKTTNPVQRISSQDFKASQMEESEDTTEDYGAEAEEPMEESSEIQSLQEELKNVQEEKNKILSKKQAGEDKLKQITPDELKDMIIGHLDRAMQLLRYL